MPQGNKSASTKNLWAAFKRFATYVDETEKLVDRHISAVSRLIGIPDFLKGIDEPEDSAWLISAIKEAEHAKDEVSKDFPLLHAHSLLGVWSALEVLVEDIAAA